MSEDLKYWAALATLPETGPGAMLRMYERFRDLSLAWTASELELEAAGVEPFTARAIVKTRGKVEPEAELEKILELGARLITYPSEEYPPLLRKIPSPPAVLYVKGALVPADYTQTVAIVGTREMSAYGQQVTERLSRDLAGLGITIASGLARGIDSVAHKSALAGKGRTIAVMGTGIDAVYPRENRRLAAEIEESGALLTEFPPGTEPAPERFPQRNRIISGLSLGTVVTEAPARSGALITASYAGDQGRDVMAVPGDVFSVLSAGCNELIRDGAVLVRSAEDVLEAVNFAASAVQLPLDLEPPAWLEGDERRIAEVLSTSPLHLDEIARAADMPVHRISALLAVMELKGTARNVGGGNYVLGRVFPARQAR